MKHKTLKSPIIMMALLLFAVVCVVNVTYSYFTSTSSAEGQMTLPNLDVYFHYETEDDYYVDLGLTKSLNLIPVDGLIEREVPFSVKISDNTSSFNEKQIEILSIYSGSGSAYVRFWVDVYVVKTENNGGVETEIIDKSKNYGKYFSVPFASSVGVYSSEKDCYYVKSSLSAGISFVNISLPSNEIPTSVSVSVCTSSKVIVASSLMVIS